MAWDSSRPVPWRRLVREWLIYVAIMAVIFVAFFRERGLIGALAGLFISGPLYLGLGYVLAKLGYQRRTWRELRADRPEPGGHEPAPASGSARRDRPPPTKRTSSGPNRQKAKRRRR